MKLDKKTKKTNTNLDNIPDEMKKYHQWVCWKAERRENGKTAKIPINPIDGTYAKTSAPATWGRFEDAESFCRSNGFDGVGFVFTKDDPFVGIDIDGCIEPDSGLVDDKADRIVQQMHSYTETSPSGKGLHIIAKGVLPQGGKRKDGVEVYDCDRFFTFTGNRLGNSSPIIEDRSDEIERFYRETFQPKPADSHRSLSAEDRNLLDSAFQSKNGDGIQSLWQGEITGYQSHSEADLALCGHLSFWTNGDVARIDRLFRASKLYRKKWDERRNSSGRTYGQITIEKAINSWSPSETDKEDKPKSDEPEFKCTDLGNSERLVHYFGDDLRYCSPLKSWFFWDGRRWSRDVTEKVRQYGKKAVRKIHKEAEKAPDARDRKDIAKHAMQSESEARIRAMISLARSDENIAVLPEEMDLDPWLLNCLNGTVDLKTGKLLSHDRQVLITKLAPVQFDENAQCPLWLSFLNRIMNGNDNLISFLQRAVGYSLTGDTSEQCLFIFYGAGANGKSTFLQTINSMLGDYATQTPTETLLVKQKGAIPNDVARLKGARFVTASEAENGQRLAESLIKQMTGGDTISARFLHQEWFDFDPTHKIFLGTNHKPVINGTDEAIWRRIRLVPFEVTIPEPERDRNLIHKLEDELPGILAWAVKGCLQWQEEGLGIPEEVKVATQSYRCEMDILADFISDCCTIDESASVAVKDLYEAYRRWCDLNGEKALKKPSLARKLQDKGFLTVRGSGGVWIRRGLCLRSS